ncbi:hypothetical protein [Nocardiopsis protaetiae]|uniref:hypothetical protein n=1 Tax=Nocardiopsis protaetiae TaxID=3382270 RepID=UPI00387AA919
MRTRPTPNPDPDFDFDSEDLPAEVRNDPLLAFMNAPYLHPHPEPGEGEAPGAWPETPYLLLLQGATDNTAEAEHVLTPDEDAAWATDMMRRMEWLHVCAVNHLRTMPPEEDVEDFEPTEDEEWLEEIGRLTALGTLAEQTVREPDRYRAAYLARVREFRRMVEEEAAADPEADGEAEARLRRWEREEGERLRELDEHVREMEEIHAQIAYFGPRQRSRPLSRVITAVLGLGLVAGGLSALSLPYAFPQLAALCAIALSAFIVWSNLRHDLETSRPVLVGGALVGLAVGASLSGLLHDGLTYLFEQSAPQAAAAAQGDVVTAGLYGLAALVCWALAATGVGGVCPPAGSIRPEDPETAAPA